jgi:hypothetical protein
VQYEKFEKKGCLRIRFMGFVLMQVELISLAKLPKEENYVEMSSPGRTERNLKKFDVFIRNLHMGLNSMGIQNLP